MRRPILKDIVSNFEKRTKRSISPESVYRGLAFIAESWQDPWKTKKQNEAIEKQKGTREAGLRIFISLIEPEDLEEGDTWDRGKACIET